MTTGESSPSGVPPVARLIEAFHRLPGIGPKTAATAVRAFGRIEDIPADPEAWAGLGVRGARRAAARLAEHRELALRTRSLATVVADVPGVGIVAHGETPGPATAPQSGGSFHAPPDHAGQDHDSLPPARNSPARY